MIAMDNQQVMDYDVLPYTEVINDHVACLGVWYNGN